MIITFVCIVYLTVVLCWLLLKALQLAPKTLALFGLLLVIPFAPLYFAPKAWGKQPKWLIVLTLLAYFAFAGLLLYGATLP